MTRWLVLLVCSLVGCHEAPAPPAGEAAVAAASSMAVENPGLVARPMVGPLPSLTAACGALTAGTEATCAERSVRSAAKDALDDAAVLAVSRPSGSTFHLAVHTSKGWWVSREETVGVTTQGGTLSIAFGELGAPTLRRERLPAGVDGVVLEATATYRSAARYPDVEAAAHAPTTQPLSLACAVGASGTPSCTEKLTYETVRFL